MALAEVVEDAVAVLLVHLGVDVEARVAEVGDLLRQQLHSLRRVAEDDGLVDLQLKKKTIISRLLSHQSEKARY